MKLRDYQRQAIDETKRHLADRPVLVAPTGSGKTFMAASLVRELGLRTLWLAHRRELIQQAYRRLRGCGLECGMILAGYPEMRMAQVQVASIQTLARRVMPHAELVVMDECHHARASTYRRVLDHYTCPIVGLTATPFRLDGKGLGDIFRSLVVAAYSDDLCAVGTLIDPIVYAPDAPSLDGVRVRMGDYAAGGSYSVMSRPKIVGNVVETWRRHAAWKRTVCFAVNVEHSQQLVAAFRERGVPAEHLDGATALSERQAILRRLETGETHVVSNCMVLTEGWDLPALEVAIIARPTASLCMHLQMIGRIMRAAQEKEGCLVLDHAGNHLRLGLVTQRIDYSLDDVVQRTSRGVGEGEAPLKSCPSCFMVLPGGTRVCPGCQHEFRAAVPEQADGELTQFAPRHGAPFDERRRAWDHIEYQREEWGFKEGWSFYRYRARFGVDPVTVRVEGQRVLIDPRRATDIQKRAAWEELDAVRRERGYKPGYTGVRFKAMFGHWPRWKASA